MNIDMLTAVPFAAVSSVATWFFQGLAHRRAMAALKLDHAASVDISRDDLAIELLSSARSEVVTARAEMESLREEIKSLRAMETHFYHFQQALEHLSAVLFAKNAQERVVAERNARGFLKRMARLRDAKGTIANEAQRLDSVLSQEERKVREEGGAL